MPMPGWFTRKSTKPSKSYDTLPLAKKTTSFQIFDSPKSSSNKSSPKSPNKRAFAPAEFKPRSSDDSLAGASLKSQGTGNSSGFSGFDSDSGSAGKKTECHPLPTPLVSSNSPCYGGLDHGSGGVGAGAGAGAAVLVNGGSASVSSVSSSGSSDDTPPPLHEQFAQLGVSRGLDDVKLRVRARSPGPPGTRGPTISMTSPRHPRMGGSSNLESPTGKAAAEDQGHPLPLPPSSPTSPSAMHNSVRSSFTPETISYCDPSKWMKGKLLGRGTFGHVYLGFNSEKGQMCAIKEVRLISDDRNSKECLKQLNQEITLLSQLSHPNIVRYYGSELGEEALSVYLEYVSGGSIHKLLQEYGPFKEPVVQNYTRQILYGLAYLHARKTVHRDIKGANILVDPHGEIKLADFGMAKHITNCTSMLSFKGSPYWMAPEVVMNTNGYSLAVDIWSLGCTVLEMCTSKPPWSQYEGVAAIFKIGNSKEIPEIPDYLSHDAKDFLRRCFQRDPLARPSATELLGHPFVRDQTMMRAPGSPGLSVAPEAFPFAFDGPQKPKALEINPRRKSISTYEVDDARRLVVPGSRELWDNSRTIISLPVSPCSSPLRQSGPAYKSCYVSPPHPAYALVGQTSQTSGDFLLSSTRAARPQSYLPDPLNDVHTLYRFQTPGGSSRVLL